MRIIILIATFMVLMIAEAGQTQRMLVVSGHSAEVPIMDLNGRSYVDLEALARAMDASLSSNGNKTVLTVPGVANPGSTARADHHSANAILSKDFLRAGIEAMSVIREWRGTLTNAVQRGYPITEDWIGNYRDEARKNLHLAEVAVSTPADKDCFPLLTNVFNNMNALNDRFLEATRTRTYIRPDSLSNDPLDQRIMNCAHSLAAIAANGQFVDDGSCH
jgi:hypothetical protein